MALEHLLAALERDARTQRGERLERARREAEALVADGQARLARERSERLGALEAELGDRSRERLLQARRAAQRAILEARRRLFDDVLREAAGRLPETLHGGALRASLPGVITEALRYVGGGPAVVSCAASLVEDVGQALRGRPGVVVRADPAVPAGVRVESADGALVVHATLEDRLEQLRPELLIGMLRDLEEGA